MDSQELLNRIELAKDSNLLDIVINDEIYWIVYMTNENSFVIDSFSDLPKYFDSSIQAANYLSQLTASAT